MEKIYAFFDSITPEGFDAEQFLRFVAIFALGSLVFGFVARLIFGKKSNLNRAVSAAIAILCIYVVNVVVYSCGLKIKELLSPLPFVTIAGDYLNIFNFFTADFATICAQILDMVILAFLMNLLDSWLPQGKKLFGWFFFRILSVVLAICLQYIIALALDFLVPAGLAAYAPMILVIILIAALLLGALKLLVGIALATINPIIGALYTFFFSTLVGKQLSKAVLTTILLSALVHGLNVMGYTVISLAGISLAMLLPVILVLLALWYLINQVL